MTEPPHPDLGILIALAFQGFVRDLRAFHVELGFDDLGRSDGYVFRALDDQPTTVSALAKRLDVSKQGAAQIVDDMERRGYLLRAPDPDDRRARLVALSPRGRQALAAARQFHAATERRLADSYGPGAVSALRAMLTDLAGGSDDGSDPQLRAMSV